MTKSIKGIGIDMIEIERIEQAKMRHGEHFLARLFTEKERAYCSLYKNPAQHFAGRFAAKEAISKALGVGFGKELSWQDLEILPDEKGKPVLFLSKEALERFSHPEIMLSITHCKGFAVANAIYLSS